jgi:hypothetical protein
MLSQEWGEIAYFAVQKGYVLNPHVLDDIHDSGLERHHWLEQGVSG